MANKEIDEEKILKAQAYDILANIQELNMQLQRINTRIMEIKNQPEKINKTSQKQQSL